MISTISRYETQFKRFWFKNGFEVDSALNLVMALWRTNVETMDDSGHEEKEALARKRLSKTRSFTFNTTLARYSLK